MGKRTIQMKYAGDSNTINSVAFARLSKPMGTSNLRAHSLVSPDYSNSLPPQYFQHQLGETGLYLVAWNRKCREQCENRIEVGFSLFLHFLFHLCLAVVFLSSVTTEGARLMAIGKSPTAKTAARECVGPTNRRCANAKHQIDFLFCFYVVAQPSCCSNMRNTSAAFRRCILRLQDPRHTKINTFCISSSRWFIFI